MDFVVGKINSAKCPPSFKTTTTGATSACLQRYSALLERARCPLTDPSYISATVEVRKSIFFHYNSNLLLQNGRIAVVCNEKAKMTEI